MRAARVVAVIACLCALPSLAVCQISVGFDVEVHGNSSKYPGYNNVKACLDPQFMQSFHEYGYACDRLNCTLSGTMFFSLKSSGTAYSTQIDGDGCGYVSRVPSSSELVIKAVASIRGPATHHTNPLSMDYGSHMDPQGRFFYVSRPGAGVRKLTPVSEPLDYVKNVSACSLRCSSDALHDICSGYVYTKSSQNSTATGTAAGSCSFFTDSIDSTATPALLTNDVEVFTKMSFQQIISGPYSVHTRPPWGLYSVAIAAFLLFSVPFVVRASRE